MTRARTAGSLVTGGGVEFRVWAPGHDGVDVVVYGPDAEAIHPMEPEGDGWFCAEVEGAGAGTRYKYRLDGGEAFPDPASRAQPDGVHGASEVVDPTAFRWTDAGWRGIPLDEMVIYELHVGTATPEGTFDGLIARLDHFAELGVNALELMPVASFAGDRNWGYDGVALYAPARAYGGPAGLRRLVDAAHAKGLAVILDVVYNHLGPEGNYLPLFTSGRFFTDRHKTPWGDAVNYDGPDCGAVRDFVVGNAVHWVAEYHADGLRLDATHAILDDSEWHVLQELAVRTRQAAAPRHLALIAEDERNECRVVAPQPDGLGLGAVWADDFHHEVRRMLAGDSESYFGDYAGTAGELAETLREGWFYRGQHSKNRGCPRGTSTEGLPPRAFVHCIQNHDQVGNRALGGRLHHEIDPPAYRAASALLLFSPYTPMLWMGQEWAASTPFLYFTDHPEELGKLVTEGRREEFKKFSAFADPEVREHIPDPQAESSFQRSKLRWEETGDADHAPVLALYRELLRLRRAEPALARRDRAGFAVAALDDSGIALRRTGERGVEMLLVASFAGPLRADLAAHDETRPADGCRWDLVLSTEEPRFGRTEEGEPVSVTADGVVEMRGPGAVILRNVEG
ncbi:MAG TPA: malto-oligosyltrehalose trehalohydrolase [Longimicrobiaceae bacterium]|nr:malto-oligosyltrehalose trehalohydrolase [Longimicrobiaceae bacterium]